MGGAIYQTRVSPFWAPRGRASREDTDPLGQRMSKEFVWKRYALSRLVILGYAIIGRAT